VRFECCHHTAEETGAIVHPRYYSPDTGENDKKNKHDASAKSSTKLSKENVQVSFYTEADNLHGVTIIID
jgi:hypothetical protein